MLKSILKANAVIIEMLDFSGKLSKYEIDILEKFTAILNPFGLQQISTKDEGQVFVRVSLIQSGSFIMNPLNINI